MTSADKTQSIGNINKTRHVAGQVLKHHVVYVGPTTGLRRDSKCSCCLSTVLSAGPSSRNRRTAELQLAKTRICTVRDLVASHHEELQQIDNIIKNSAACHAMP